jgi:hypothetical protein
MLKLSNVFYGWIIVGISTLVFAIVRGVNDAFSLTFPYPDLILSSCGFLAQT